MKKLFSLTMAVLLTICLAACQSETVQEESSVSTSLPVQSQENESNEPVTEPPAVSVAPSSEDIADTEPVQRQIQMTAEGQTYIITLYKTPATDALYEMLPLELNFEDYNNVEKIAYLPDNETLPIEGEADGYDPAVGDICLYAPWGNLSLFYQEFGYSHGLISLGRLEAGIEEIAAFPDGVIVTLERME